MKAILVLTILLISSINCFSGEPTHHKDLPTVDFVNLTLFQGDWYEIARLPSLFEFSCYCSFGKYTLQNDELYMLHQCWRDGPDGRLIADGAKAKSLDKTNSKLEIQYHWPWKSKFYIIEIDKDYKWALVGSPNRDHLWILSRKNALDEKQIRKLVDRALDLEFPVHRLIRTYQSDRCHNRDDEPRLIDLDDFTYWN